MKRIKLILGSLFGSLSLVPALVFAQGNFNTSNGLESVLEDFKLLMDYVVPIIIGLAIIVFLWGVLKFILNAGDEGKRSEGKMFMIYGIIGIVVMVSVWGLVGFLQTTFGLEGGNAPDVPELPESY